MKYRTFRAIVRFIMGIISDIEVVGMENEGIYFFDDKEEAEQFYKALIQEHYSSDEENEFKDEDGQSDLSN